MKLKVVSLVGSFLLLVGSTHASIIDQGLLDIPGLGDPAGEESYLEGVRGYDLTYLQKWNTEPEGFEESPGIGIYTFTPSNNVSNMSITWDLTGTGFALDAVLVKDGDGIVGTFYHLYGVTPDQKLNSLSPQPITINNDKGISHVSFFGVPSGPDPSDPVIPEPASLAIWGLGVLACGTFSLRQRRKIIRESRAV